MSLVQMTYASYCTSCEQVREHCAGECLTCSPVNPTRTLPEDGAP